MKLLPCLVVVVLCISVFANWTQTESSAQAVVTRLPDQGVWARYEYRSEISGKQGPVMTSEGSVTIRCLDSVSIDGKSFRWIEIKQKGRQAVGDPFVMTWKLLVAPDALGSSKPLGRIRKVWKKVGDQEPREFVKGGDDFDRGLMGLERFFNKAEPIDSQDLDKVEYELSSGEKLDCSVKEADYGGSSRTVVRTKLTTYHNSGSPFGLVRAVWKSEDVKSGSKTIDWMVDDFRLVEVGKGAVSSMPDNK